MVNLTTPTFDNRVQKRLRYLFAEGIIEALRALGWDELEKRENTCPFQRGDPPDADLLTFPKLKALPQAYVERRIKGTDNLDLDRLLEAYVDHYKGDPPLMAM